MASLNNRVRMPFISTDDVARVARKAATDSGYGALSMGSTGGETPLLCPLKKDWSMSIRHAEDDFKRWYEI